MTRILIVDDEYDKARAISEVVLEHDASIEIEHATTSAAARRFLTTKKFDLLIVDLNLPDVLGAAPTHQGGLALFDMLIMDESAWLPPDILFLTAREELVEVAQANVRDRGASFCLFNETADSSWKAMLVGKLHLASARVKRVARLSPRADVAIVTALGTPELDAVLNLNYQWANKRFPDDPTGYHFGQIPRAEGPLTVVAASARRKGMPSSAALAAKMVERFRPRYIVMLGICAGVKGKTELGDVIVADPSWDWGSGKLAEKPDGSVVFQAAPYQRPLSSHVSQLAMELSSRPEVVAAIRSGWTHSAPAGKFSVRVGPMASGAAVLATDGALDPITAQNRELLGVEMEAYAVMAAADYARQPAPCALAIKSVCDFADAEKGDNWQAYAAYTSAAFFNQLFLNRDLPLT
ncbi:hypothetical protein WJ12_11970 [Burkholderia seminalis]|uniref:phosphorylase family protein n=1 Tax=Burkholderia seminalis TaxID=488731 RepID=UPI0008415FE8|nr:response regulator [Burkholderia seminalis]AOJ25497.1 hypothetical protein WJ12_11970 [Burkholderia seminalis]MCA8043472.1 response regulator [Burkholderia seminalis]